MEPPTSAASTTGGSKLRLMCSYGGHIIPRPQTKSLFYAGGDTRIITVPTTTANLSLNFLAAQLAAALRLSTPFNLKYQLPYHDLDSLITLSNDEDVAIMIDEHNRVFPSPARIRLFVFPAKHEVKSASNAVELGMSEFTHPKKESWFVDVLESAKIMQRGGAVGFAGEGHGEGNNGGGDAIVGRCGAESIVLETSLSFGSTSSSGSSSNSPAKCQIEDTGAGLQDSKVKLPSPESIPSDKGLGTPISQPNQDSIGCITTMEGKVASNPIEPERKTSEAEITRAVPISMVPSSFPYDQPQQVQYIHTPTGLQYLTSNPGGVMQMPSYYMMNPPLAQQPVYYQTNQPQPIYFVQVPPQTCSNMPMQSGLVSSSTIPSNRPPLHPNSSLNPAHVSYKVAAIPSQPELSSQAYTRVSTASPLANVPPNSVHQQGGGSILQINLQGQPASVAPVDESNYINEDDHDATHAQIYKSQPPPPALPSQYQTVTKAQTTLLADALAQLNTDNNLKPQLVTSQQ
ncbi:hypothetical protein LINPERPRIM_LOCUS43550 [Linum perenne]